MRKILLLILSLFSIVTLTACSGNTSKPSTGGNPQTSFGQTSSPESSKLASNDSSEPVSSNSTSSPEIQPSDNGKKVLVAYFSATGTTKALAEYAADAVNGDLYEIVPQEPYTSVEHILRYIARTTERLTTSKTSGTNENDTA